jgi:hypothetical protein
MKVSAHSIPIYIVDEHNQALFFWFKAKYENLIKEPLDLFHVDAHNDLGRPETFRKSLYAPGGSTIDILEYYRTFVETELQNFNFIIPAVLAGLARNVYFIYPKWRHYKPSRRHMNVASVFGEGKILKHGIKPAKQMETRAHKALPDQTLYTFFMLDIDGIPRDKNVILDIDIDYFACRDSISNQFCYELAITPEQFQNRDGLLSDKTLEFARLSFDFLERNDGYYVKVTPKPEKEESHLPSQEEITAEIDALISTLQTKRIKPQVVTIARSSISGYCPVEYVEGIEKELTGKLERFLAA